MDVVDGITERRYPMTDDETLAEMGLGSALLETDPAQRHGADQTQPTPTYEEVRAADAQLKQAWEAVGTTRRALVDATTRAVAALEAFDRLDGKRRAYLDSDLATEPDASQVSEPDPQASSSEGTSRQEPTVGDTGTGTPATVTGPTDGAQAAPGGITGGIDFGGVGEVDDEGAMDGVVIDGVGYFIDKDENYFNAEGQQVDPDNDYQVISGATGVPDPAVGEVAADGEVTLGPPPSTTAGLDPVIQRLLDNEKMRLERGDPVRSIDEAEQEFGLGGDDGVDGGGTFRRARTPRGPAQAPARQAAPQWTSIQSISAGIDATADPKRVVLLAVSSADEARTVLQNGLDPQTFGDDFRKGLQVEGVTSADVKGLLRKRAERIPEKDRKKAFVIIGRAEYEYHIEPENIIGVAPMSTFRPSVVSLFEEETVTGTETAEESAADDTTSGGASDGML
jgi:hypothetical protein